jgi:hypothetical protein
MFGIAEEPEGLGYSVVCDGSSGHVVFTLEKGSSSVTLTKYASGTQDLASRGIRTGAQGATILTDVSGDLEVLGIEYAGMSAADTSTPELCF